MDQTSTLWEYLYRQRPPEGKSILILVQPVSIKDGPPDVGEIAVSVRKLQSSRVGRPSRMKAEHFKAWLLAAKREKDPDTKTWDKVVSVIKIAFREGYIPEALM